MFGFALEVTKSSSRFLETPGLLACELRRDPVSLQLPGTEGT